MKKILEKLKLKKRTGKPSLSLKCCMPIVDKTILILGFRVSLLSLLSYIADWLVYGLVALIAAILYHSEPLFQEFSLKDRYIMYSYIPEIELITPVWSLIICAIVIPFLTSFLASVFSVWKWPRKLWDTHVFMLGLAGALAFQFIITTVLKNSVGKPRPDFLHRCKPHDYIPPFGTLANIAICSNKNLFILWDGYRSFPSGHATIAFTSATYHFLYNAGRFRIFDGRGLSWKFLFAAVPFCTGCWASVSGITDNRNFLEDVIAGMVIGVLIAWIFYRMYFPSVFDTKNGGKAYPPRRFGIPYFGGGTSFYPFAQEMVLYSQQPSTGLSMSIGGSTTLRSSYAPPPPPPAAPPPVIQYPPVAMAPNIVVNIKKHPNHYHHTTNHSPNHHADAHQHHQSHHHGHSEFQSVAPMGVPFIPVVPLNARPHIHTHFNPPHQHSHQRTQSHQQSQKQQRSSSNTNNNSNKNDSNDSCLLSSFP